MRMILLFFALSLAGVTASASAAERIFADGFEPCCSLGGEVTGLTGNGFVLHLTVGAVNEDKPVPAHGGALRLYTFANTAPPGSGYVVTITTQPTDQTCTLVNATGTVASTPIDNINATCVAGPLGLDWDDGSWDEADWK